MNLFLFKDPFKCLMSVNWWGLLSTITSGNTVLVQYQLDKVQILGFLEAQRRTKMYQTNKQPTWGKHQPDHP